jgi:hypothetical protein
VTSRWANKDGSSGAHTSVLLRQTWREDGKVRHHTVASLTGRPPEEIAALEAALNKGSAAGGGAVLGPPRVSGGLSHGAVAAVWELACDLGLPRMMGPACRERDLALALVVARLVRPASKTATLAWLKDTTLGVDLGLDRATSDDAFAAMDWLLARQPEIEAALAARHLGSPTVNPSRMALFDLTSTWVEGTACPLAAFGHSRDRKREKRQIEFALVTSPDGVPVAVRAFKGNTADTTAFTTAIEAVAQEFQITDAVMVGDRGMVNQARIDDLRQAGLGWLSALRRPQIAALAADSGNPFQPSPLDEWGLFEFTSDRFPGERLIARLNPDLAERNKAKRERLIEASLEACAPVIARIEKGRLKDPAAIGRATERATRRYKVQRLLTIETGPSRLAVGRDNLAVTEAERLDGIHLVRTSVPRDALGPEDAVRAYEQLSNVERDFSWIKGDDIDVRPIWRHREDRVRAHLLVCLLAAHLAWRLRRAWAPLTYQDTEPKDPHRHPVEPQARSRSAAAKAHARRLPDGGTPRTFRGLLDHLGLLQRQRVTVDTGQGPQEFTVTAQPGPDQARAFELLGLPIPDRLTVHKPRRRQGNTTRNH